MAYTERYVTAAAAGGGDGLIATPWTLAEAFANAVAGQRVNILSDGAYSLGATTITNAGTTAQMVCYRGYESAIGDLDTQGRNADGSLNTTNFPAITLTGSLDLPTASYCLFMNLNITGALSTDLIGTTASDGSAWYQCKITNTQNNSAAKCMDIDDGHILVMCDFDCTGAAHGNVVDIDNTSLFFACKFSGTSSTPSLLNYLDNIDVIGCLFVGAGGDGITMSSAAPARATYINNTAYACNRAFEFPAAVWNTVGGASNRIPVLINNHVTDNTEYANFLFSGTANTAAIDLFNRTRDNTTGRTGFGDALTLGEVTTDTGGAETDYANAGAEDFQLIAGAPGEDAGLAIG